MNSLGSIQNVTKYMEKKGPNVIVSSNIPVGQTGNNGFVFYEINNTTTSGTGTINFNNVADYQNGVTLQMVLIGGGGSGGYNNTNTSAYGPTDYNTKAGESAGGGGGAQITISTQTLFSDATVTISPGSAGIVPTVTGAGKNGGNTSVSIQSSTLNTTITAIGGYGGGATRACSGGNSGNGKLGGSGIIGVHSVTDSWSCGGGGAGCGANGTTAINTGGSTQGNWTTLPVGGAGLKVTASQMTAVPSTSVLFTKFYCGGGGGWGGGNFSGFPSPYYASGGSNSGGNGYSSGNSSKASATSYGGGGGANGSGFQGVCCFIAYYYNP